MRGDAQMINIFTPPCMNTFDITNVNAKDVQW